MSRPEFYPWSLLTEVGDYFCVPEDIKPHSYTSTLVNHRNYKSGGKMRYICSRTTYGSIVMLAQVADEIPPHEFVDASGFLVSTSRNHVNRLQHPDVSPGSRPIMPERTQAQKIDAMTPEQKLENLPWWYDKRTGNLVVNPNLVKEKESELWMAGKFNPGANTPYPPEYNLDENLMRKTREQLMEEDDEEDEASLWEGMDVTGESDEDDGNDE